MDKGKWKMGDPNFERGKKNEEKLRFDFNPRFIINYVMGFEHNGKLLGLR